MSFMKHASGESGRRFPIREYFGMGARSRQDPNGEMIATLMRAVCRRLDPIWWLVPSHVRLRMRDRRAFLAIALLVAATAPAHAFAPDGCEQQRKQYPANWDDTSTEKTLFTCELQQARFYVKIGVTDKAGRTLMSLVPFSRRNAGVTNAGVKVETGHDVLRIWLDKEQARRLRDGKYSRDRPAQGELLLDPRQHRGRPRLPPRQRPSTPADDPGRLRGLVLQQGPADHRRWALVPRTVSRSNRMRAFDLSWRGYLASRLVCFATTTIFHSPFPCG